MNDYEQAAVSEYTPTTDVVRHAYVARFHVGNYDEPAAEFDRWLAQVKEAAKLEGAIEALEEAAKVIPGSDSGIGAVDPYDLAADWLARCAARLREGQQ